MKIINSVIVLMILVSESQLSHGKNLNCNFQDLNFGLVGLVYSCAVSSLVNTNNNLNIDGYSGNHEANKNNADVKGIYIHDTNTKYIPTNLGSLFHLTLFIMHNSQLIEIKAKDFHGMQDLEQISLKNNKLTSVSLDAFATLTKLRFISLSANQIEELPYGIFGNNLELKQIYLQYNKIKYLGTEIFNDLKKLNHVDLERNSCVNKRFDGATEINQLKNYIKMYCKNPNEVTTTPKTTTQNPLEVKLFEMQEKNSKLEKELREAKELQKKNEAELTNENESLMKQLTESKALQQKDRVEIEKLKTALVEAKEIQMKCEAKTQDITAKLSNCEDALKKELKDAKELLMNCELNLEKAMKSSFNIVCEFQMTVEGYSCDARDLLINQKQMELNKVSGTHLMSKTNENVTELKIANSSMLFWSNDIFKTFPGLQTLIIHKAQLKELSQGDFNSATNLKNLKVQGNVIRVLGDDLFQGAEEHLTNIDMDSNEIVKISTGTFHGLKQLKMLSLKDNLITELQLGTFKDVVMLENLFLSGNKIKFLNGKLFEFNVKLMTLAVDHNELREIGEDILDYSVALKDVDFNGNDCIYHDFKGSEWGIDDLKFNIKHCCKNQAQALNVYNCGHRGWD